MAYFILIQKGHMNYNIAQLEVINIVVTFKIWAPYWSSQVHCYNMAVVEVLQNGRVRDATLANCARNIWLL